MTKKYVLSDNFAPSVKSHRSLNFVIRKCECTNCGKRFKSSDAEPICLNCYSDEVDWLDNPNKVYNENMPQ